MIRKLAIAAIVVPSVVGMLSSCGGGGGGGGGGAVSPPPAAPSPPASPPPPPPPPPLPPLSAPNMGAISGATTFYAATTMMSGSNNAYWYTNGYARPAGLETVAYNPADGSFTLTLNNNWGSPSYAQTFQAADIVASETTAQQTVYARGGDRLTIMKPRGSTFETGYVSLATWSTDNGASYNGGTVSARGVTLFGYQTPFFQMPNSGKANYSLAVRGNYADNSGARQLTGDGLLTADFASSTVDARFNLSTVDSNGQTAAWRSFTGPGVIYGGPLAGASNVFRGNALTNDNGFVYSGGFYGPTAAEVGGVIWVSSLNATNSDRAVGGFVGATRDATTARPPITDAAMSLTASSAYRAISADLDRLNGTVSGRFQIFAYETVSYNAETDTFVIPREFTTVQTTDLLTRASAESLRPQDLDTAASGPDRRVYRFDEAGLRATLYRQGASPYALNYVAIGSWERSQTISTMAKYFVYGKNTPSGLDPLSTGRVPTSGNATYAISAVGSRYAGSTMSGLTGSGAITAHFAPRNFDVNLSLYDNRTGSSVLWDTFSATNAGAYITDPANSLVTHNTSWPGSERPQTFTISAAGGSNPLTMDIVGSFYGPSAVEIGGAFTVNNAAGDNAAAGAFVGVRP